MVHDYYIRWSEQHPDHVHEIPLGIYSGGSADGAIRQAARESGLDADSMSAEPLASPPRS